MAIQKRTSSLVVMLVVVLLVAAPLCCMTASILYSGESMKPGDTISWANNQVVMQRDCDLVYYSNGRRLWASKTSGMGADCYCTLQSDGNWVVYDNRGTPLWSSDTKRGQGFYVLIAQKDRNLVIYGTARWATNTTI